MTTGPGIEINCQVKSRAGRWVILLDLPGWLATDINYQLMDTGGFVMDLPLHHDGMVRAELTQPLPLVE